MRIASEMTLGEAIVRGILNPPKYVLSLFTYQNELDKYEARVRQARSKALRDKGVELLDALRRALEKAEGMDEIFARHMPEANGKYIVFCANAEHMREMIGKAPEERKKRLDALGMIWGREDTIHSEAQDAAENQDPDRLPSAVRGAGRALLPAGRGRGGAAPAADPGLHARQQGRSCGSGIRYTCEPLTPP